MSMGQAGYPNIPADTNCGKCHGTGYKKGRITGRLKACKRCAVKYGTDLNVVKLELSNKKAAVIPAGLPNLPASANCVECRGSGYVMNPANN